MGIQQKLSKFPVPPQVWEEYDIDQEINDRGVRIDMELVEQAIQMPESTQSAATDGTITDPRGGSNLYGLSLGERAWGRVREIA